MTFLVPPGATPLDEDDLEHLKFPITTQAQLDAFEFDNIHKAQEKYFSTKKFIDATWFTPTFLRGIHMDMFGEVWGWAGQERKREVVPIGVKPYEITTSIVELVRDVEYWLLHQSNMTHIEMSARIHHRLTWIHPFRNGNGRFSRFVSDLFLFSYRCSLPNWYGDLNRTGNHRSEYLHVLRDADRGDFNPLIDYFVLLGAKDPNALTKAALPMGAAF